MNQVVELSELHSLLRIAKEKSEEFSILGRYLNMTLGKSPMGLFSVILNPKKLDAEIASEWKIHQNQFAEYFAKAMSRFPKIRKFLKKYSANVEFIQFLLEMEEEAYNFREQRLYKLYPEMKEYEAVIIRNDFLCEKESRQVYQIENNMVVVGCSHYSDATNKFLKRIYYQLDMENLFKSKGFYTISDWILLILEFLLGEHYISADSIFFYKIPSPKFKKLTDVKIKKLNFRPNLQTITRNQHHQFRARTNLTSAQTIPQKHQNPRI